MRHTHTRYVYNKIYIQQTNNNNNNNTSNLLSSMRSIESLGRQVMPAHCCPDDPSFAVPLLYTTGWDAITTPFGRRRVQYRVEIVFWPSNVDPLGWETIHANFLERFLMAYWYIDATNRAWNSCNPPNPIGLASFCGFERADFGASTIPNRQYTQDRAARWLSGTHHCQRAV